MRNIQIKFTTVLTTRQVGELFRDATADTQGLRGKAITLMRSATSHGAVRFEYFTPRDDTPFGDLDDDSPDFSVGVIIPKYAGTSGGVVVLHLYVWDRGANREVLLGSPHTIGGIKSSRKAVAKLFAEYQGEDPTIVPDQQGGDFPDIAGLEATEGGTPSPSPAPRNAPSLDRATLLQRGANMPLPTAQIRVMLLWNGGADDDLDASALLCGSDGRAFDSEAMVFYNQPSREGGAVRMEGRARQDAGTLTDTIVVDLPRLPGTVSQVVFTASLDGSGAATLAAIGGLRVAVLTDSEALAVFPLSGLTSESAVVSVEVYRRAGGWRLRGVGQGWADGLLGLARDYGIDVTTA
jgi:stress response protein SCP2